MSRAWVWASLVTACGGSCPEAASASAAAPAATIAASVPSSEEAAAPGDAKTAPEHNHAPDKAPEPEGATQASPQKDAPSAPDPAFPDNATVAQAIAAIPQGTTRADVDADTLGVPLQNEELYARCKPGALHFKIRVAVWNGRAVGVDVTAPTKALAACIDAQVRSVEWRDKVHSLNTVDFSM